MKTTRFFITICAFCTLVFISCNKSEQQTEQQEIVSADSVIVQEQPTPITLITDFLRDSIGSQYLQGEICIPCPIVIATDTTAEGTIHVYGDFWVFNYNISGDTLINVSGGSHPGCFEIRNDGEQFNIISFDRTTDGAGFIPSAKRIFGSYYDKFMSIQSNQEFKEEQRKKSTKEYVNQNSLNINYYKDYGWDAISLDK